jgi:hypothetical protein
MTPGWQYDCKADDGCGGDDGSGVGDGVADGDGEEEGDVLSTSLVSTPSSCPLARNRGCTKQSKNRT